MSPGPVSIPLPACHEHCHHAHGTAQEADAREDAAGEKQLGADLKLLAPPGPAELRCVSGKAGPGEADIGPCLRGHVLKQRAVAVRSAVGGSLEMAVVDVGRCGGGVLGGGRPDRGGEGEDGENEGDEGEGSGGEDLQEPEPEEAHSGYLVVIVRMMGAG